jgi:hypothetical protein
MSITEEDCDFRQSADPPVVREGSQYRMAWSFKPRTNILSWDVTGTRRQDWLTSAPTYLLTDSHVAELYQGGVLSWSTSNSCDGPADASFVCTSSEMKSQHTSCASSPLRCWAITKAATLLYYHGKFKGLFVQVKGLPFLWTVINIHKSFFIF